MIERVVGPIRGFYIASYACEMGELGNQYLGFSKVCTAKPPDYWEAKACCKCCGESPVSSANLAMDQAEARAKMQIANMEHPASDRRMTSDPG